MQHINSDFVHAQWDQWFEDMDTNSRTTGFRNWEKLRSGTASIKEILEDTEFDFSQALSAVSRAERILEFGRPYQIVVIGESGAGKSTLINALLEQPILVTGVGGAVTGVATYIYPASVESAKEIVNVVYRSSSEFQKLLENIEYQKNLYDGTQETSGRNLSLQEKANQTIRDIQASWDVVKKMQVEGKSISYDPVRDRVALEELMEENSVRNSEGSSERIIAGIQRIEYFLSDQVNGLSKCIMIDTPGLGARTLRHYEILRSEIENADAIILVVNARRPEQQTDEAAELMKNILFAGYTPEQQSTFSSKIFLVVNQFDVIKSEQDYRRLDISVKAIASVIAPEYLRRYGKGTNDSRYFEMVATDKDRIDHFRKRLNNFLSRNRLDLMVQEAGVLNGLAKERARIVCSAVLHNVRFDVTKMSPSALETNLTNQVCLDRLENDRKDLLQAFDQVWVRLSNQRDSSFHEQRLRDIITHIRHALLEQIAQSLPDLLRNLDVKEFDPGTQIEVTGTPANILLLRLEAAVRRRLEAEMEEQFAHYYNGMFLNEVQNARLYNQIAAKSYGQVYIMESLNPVYELEFIQKRICDDYIATCRQILIYELIQMPIIEALRRVESKILSLIETSGIFESTKPIPTQKSDSFVSPTSGSLWNKGKWGKQLQDLGKQVIVETLGIGQDSTEKQSDLSAERLRDSIFLENLQNALGSGSKSQRNAEQINQLLNAQFGQRIDNALKKSLPHLESVFFYALGNFRNRFNELASEMKQAHMLHVSDSNTNIKQILLEQNTVAITRLTRAAAILSELERQVP